jgi:flagellar biogenesis protein FliO
MAMAGEDNPEKKDGPADPFPSLLRLAGSMAIVVALILGAAFVAKKVFARSRFGNNRNKVLQVRQAMNLGARRQVFVFDVGENTLVVGATSEHMRLLEKMPRLEEQPDERPPVNGGTFSFENILGSVRGAGRSEEEQLS